MHVFTGPGDWAIGPKEAYYAWKWDPDCKHGEDDKCAIVEEITEKEYQSMLLSFGDPNQLELL